MTTGTTFWKLFALFLSGAGYEGLLILIDELVNLYKIPNSVSRQNNYEKILTIYNDMLQGRARGLGVVMSGTPQAVEDQRRGIFSYEALRSRLAAGRFSQDGRRDMMAPVIELEPLTPDELLVLIDKLAHMHADLFATGLVLSDQALARFLELEYDREGAAHASDAPRNHPRLHRKRSTFWRKIRTSPLMRFLARRRSRAQSILRVTARQRTSTLNLIFDARGSR